MTLSLQYLIRLQISLDCIIRTTVLCQYTHHLNVCINKALTGTQKKNVKYFFLFLVYLQKRNHFKNTKRFHFN